MTEVNILELIGSDHTGKVVQIPVRQIQPSRYQPRLNFDEEAMKEDEVEIVLQINGKVRDRIVVPAEADKTAMEKAALAQPKVQQYTEGKTVVKVIAVPAKLVNIVVK